MASRDYLREKWRRLKWDMELVLLVEDEYGIIPEEDIKMTRDNIVDMCTAIINEVSK